MQECQCVASIASSGVTYEEMWSLVRVDNILTAPFMVPMEQRQPSYLSPTKRPLSMTVIGIGAQMVTYRRDT